MYIYIYIYIYINAYMHICVQAYNMYFTYKPTYKNTKMIIHKMLTGCKIIFFQAYSNHTFSVKYLMII